jgi:hypothetical protein
MADRATEAHFNELHAIVADALIEQIKAWRKGRLVDMGKDGEFVKVFPPALLAQCIKFLKDNGIDQPQRTGNPVDRLAKIMPDFDKIEAGSPN